MKSSKQMFSMPNDKETDTVKWLGTSIHKIKSKFKKSYKLKKQREAKLPEVHYQPWENNISVRREFL